MSTSDLEAVVVRRRMLERDLAQFEQRRAELLAEDQELEVTERVLTRLAGYDRRAPEVTPVDEAFAPPGIESATRALRNFLSDGLENGRNALARIRSTVERRP